MSEDKKRTNGLDIYAKPGERQVIPISLSSQLRHAGINLIDLNERYETLLVERCERAVDAALERVKGKIEEYITDDINATIECNRVMGWNTRVSERGEVKFNSRDLYEIIDQIKGGK